MCGWQATPAGEKRQRLGRIVLITGSTSGIGAATARALALRGWRVVVTGRDQARGEAVVGDIAGGGGWAVFVPSDLTAPPEDLRAFARAATLAAGGQLDAVVHNAALYPPVDTVSLSDDDLEATMAVNIRAPHVLTAALAPLMVQRSDGAIVVIGSWMAHVGHPFVGLYSATKAAEIQLARSWAAEFGPAGVRVNTVSPGATRTPINADTGDVITQEVTVSSAVHTVAGLSAQVERLIALGVHEVGGLSATELRAAVAEANDVGALLIIHPDRAPVSALAALLDHGGRGASSSWTCSTLMTSPRSSRPQCRLDRCTWSPGSTGAIRWRTGALMRRSRQSPPLGARRSR